MRTGGCSSIVLAVVTASTFGVTRASPTGLFHPPVLPTGSQPVAFVLADVSGDSLPDLIVANQSFARGVVVFAGDGDGGFAPRVETAIPTSGRALAAGDLDNDGDTDLFVGNSGGGPGYVLLNTPAGFTTQPLASPPARSAAIADFDLDGHLDILVGAEGSTEVFWNSGGAVFGASDVVPGGGTVAVGDLNGDNRPEWVAVYPNSLQLTVVHNLGARDFLSATTFGVEPYDVALGDVDGDDDLDIVTANLASNTITVRWNDGTGAFSMSADFDAGSRPSTVVIADVTDDGHADVVVGNDHGERITALENNGAGWFFANQEYLAGENPVDLLAEDLNNDGCPDLLVLIEGSPGYAQVLMNRRCSSSVECPADFNRDGVVNTADFVYFASQFGSMCP